MSESDWDHVTVIRKRPQHASEARSEQAVAHARRQGQDVDTAKKYGAGGNRQHSTSLDTARLDAETEELHHERVSLDVGRAIMQARVAKGMNQKDLSTRINEKPQVVADYESGRTIPNQQILGKLERALGVRLRGKHIGEPLAPRGSKGKK